MRIESLHELMIEELRDIYHAEKQLVKALPEFVEVATHPPLKEALEKHLSETEAQVRALKQLFKDLDTKGSGKRCRAMQGILAEAFDLLDDVRKSPEPVIEAALIGICRRIEHYEIAAYSTAIAWSEELGLEAVTEALKRSLSEEEAADKALVICIGHENNAMVVA